MLSIVKRNIADYSTDHRTTSKADGGFLPIHPNLPYERVRLYISAALYSNTVTHYVRDYRRDFDWIFYLLTAYRP
jgi:hypothetical protein